MKKTFKTYKIIQFKFDLSKFADKNIAQFTSTGEKLPCPKLRIYKSFEADGTNSLDDWIDDNIEIHAVSLSARCSDNALNKKFCHIFADFAAKFNSFLEFRPPNQISLEQTSEDDKSD